MKVFFFEFVPKLVSFSPQGIKPMDVGYCSVGQTKLFSQSWEVAGNTKYTSQNTKHTPNTNYRWGKRQTNERTKELIL